MDGITYRYAEEEQDRFIAFFKFFWYALTEKHIEFGDTTGLQSQPRRNRPQRPPASFLGGRKNYPRPAFETA